jgi:hypothetical protein
MGQKKCPSCGKWNDGTKEECAFCGAMLDHKKEVEKKLRLQGRLPKKIEPSPLFEIKPEYPWWRKTILYIVAPIYWTFFGIVSFFVWLVVWAAA